MTPARVREASRFKLENRFCIVSLEILKQAHDVIPTYSSLCENIPSFSRNVNKQVLAEKLYVFYNAHFTSQWAEHPGRN